jgi:hypothetical protein
MRPGTCNPSFNATWVSLVSDQVDLLFRRGQSINQSKFYYPVGA